MRTCLWMESTTLMTLMFSSSSSAPVDDAAYLLQPISTKNYISAFNNRQVNQLHRRLWDPVSTANRKIPTSIKHRTPNVLPEPYSHTTGLRRAFKIQDFSNLKALLRIRNSDHRASKYIRWVLSHVDGRPLGPAATFLQCARHHYLVVHSCVLTIALQRLSGSVGLIFSVFLFYGS